MAKTEEKEETTKMSVFEQIAAGRKEEAIKWLKEINKLIEDNQRRRKSAESMIASTAIEIADSSPFVINDDTEPKEVVEFYEEKSRYERYKEEESLYDMFVKKLTSLSHRIWHEHNLCDADLKEKE